MRSTYLWRNPSLTTEAKTINDRSDALQRATNTFCLMRRARGILDPDSSTVDDHVILVTTHPNVARLFSFDGGKQAMRKKMRLTANEELFQQALKPPYEFNPQSELVRQVEVVVATPDKFDGPGSCSAWRLLTRRKLPGQTREGFSEFPDLAANVPVSSRCRPHVQK